MSNIFPQYIVDALRTMFSETECIERRNFSPLHKIVLGMVPNDLEAELATSTASINLPDSNGRTALSLASERGDMQAVEVFLRYGADTGVPSSCAAYALHYAACATEPDCLRALVVSDIDLNCGTNWNQTPLIYAAAYTKDARHAQILIDAGANADIRDLDGMVALDWAAVSNNRAVAKVLVESNVDMANVDKQGNTTLTHAIRANRHEVLEELLSTVDFRESFTTLPSNVKGNTLAVAAKYADLATLRQLLAAGFEPSEADVDAAGGKGSLFDLIEQRGDAESVMFRLFSGISNYAAQDRRGAAHGRMIVAEDDDAEAEEQWADCVEHMINISS